MSRRLARETAFKVLFQVDVGNNDPHQALERALQESVLDENNKVFVRELVEGVLVYKGKIDDVIARYLVDWALERLASVDRSILRLAVFELLYREDIPLVTTINEAVELAQTFQNEKSASFVNGLLDRVMHEEVGARNEDEFSGD